MQIFVDDPEAIALIKRLLGEELPFEYRGYPVNFSEPGYDKTQRMEKTGVKPVRHLIEVNGFGDYLNERYSIKKTGGFSPGDWLSFKDQTLIELTSGEVFHDGLEKLYPMREELGFYPEDICKLRMAVLWHYIWNKEAFVGRSIALGDFIGLKINVSRLVNYLIKILFYLEKKYIPYSKWFGTAFRKLDAYDHAGVLVRDILSENDPEKIEERLCLLYTFTVARHNAAGGMPHLDNTVMNFFGRPYKVIFAESIIEKIRRSIADEEIRTTDLRKYAYDIILDE